ncbi:hypothetical protein GCM10010495_78900 [Kitasatospora herbaricolor]|nr:hypothetical protein GCM10010495_78900 [Kitasatospora herbaricolor]
MPELLTVVATVRTSPARAASATTVPSGRHATACSCPASFQENPTAVPPRLTAVGRLYRSPGSAARAAGAAPGAQRTACTPPGRPDCQENPTTVPASLSATVLP